MGRPLHLLKQGDMNTKQGVQGAWSCNQTCILWFSLVYYYTYAVNENVCKALRRCRNSRDIVVSFRLPILYFRLTDTDI